MKRRYASNSEVDQDGSEVNVSGHIALDTGVIMELIGCMSAYSYEFSLSQFSTSCYTVMNYGGFVCPQNYDTPSSTSQIYTRIGEAISSTLQHTVHDRVYESLGRYIDDPIRYTPIYPASKDVIIRRLVELHDMGSVRYDKTSTHITIHVGLLTLSKPISEIQ